MADVAVACVQRKRAFGRALSLSPSRAERGALPEWKCWGITVAALPLVLGTVVTLVFLEGLLGADNALVLAVMVRHLPKEQQKRAVAIRISARSSSG